LEGRGGRNSPHPILDSEKEKGGHRKGMNPLSFTHGKMRKKKRKRALFLSSPFTPNRQH